MPSRITALSLLAVFVVLQSYYRMFLKNNIYLRDFDFFVNLSARHRSIPQARTKIKNKARPLLETYRDQIYLLRDFREGMLFKTYDDDLLEEEHEHASSSRDTVKKRWEDGNLMARDLLHR